MKIVGLVLLVFSTTFTAWLWQFANSGLEEIYSDNSAIAQTLAHLYVVELGSPPQYQVVRTSGYSNSLWGGFKEGFVVVDTGRPYSQLEKGMFVLRQDEGGIIHHRLVQREGDSWIMEGDGNTGADMNRLTADNYEGVTLDKKVWRY